MDYQRSDAILMEILRERKTLYGFLESIFGFLSRHTDFYIIPKDESDNVGLPKGMKEHILYSAMQRYDPEIKKNNLVSCDEEDFVPPAIEEVEIVENCQEEEEEKIISPNHIVEEVIIEEVTDEKPQDDENIFSGIDCGSGDCLYDYCWSQTLKDVEIHIRLPENVKSARNLNVSITPSNIRIGNKTNNNVILEKTFANKIKSSSVVWTIGDGKLQINSDKLKSIWWEQLFENDRKIDFTKIDCTRYVDKLPSQSQAALEKLTLDLMDEEATKISNQVINDMLNK